MVATCCLANLGSKLADMERICDPSYKCLEEKAEYVRMLLSEICGYIPAPQAEVLPYIKVSGINGNLGSTIQITVNGVPIMNVYAFTGNGLVDAIAIVLDINTYGSGFTAGGITLTSPVGSGTMYSGAFVSANTSGGFNFNDGYMSQGLPAIEENCISSDDVEAIINKIQSELNICSSLAELPETTLLTSPCGCN